MRFKTIVITKKKIITTAAILTTILTLILLGRFFRYTKETSGAFEHMDTARIISEELPDAEKITFIEKLKNKGKDMLESKNILKDYSHVFDSVPIPSSTAEPLPEETPAPTQSPTSVPEPTPTLYAEEVKNISGMKVTNATKFPVNLSELANQKLSFKKTDGPMVLIMHTHTTESYIDSSARNSDRNTDSEKNIVSVGNEIEAVLERNGIKVVHDKTVHDYPSYNGAYTRAMATIKANLEKYPSIQIVLDVHRDGLVKEDGTKLKVMCDLNGEKSAQTMLVVGTNGTGLSHGNWRENLKFAAKIQKKACQDYPNLMRPLNLREERFNQHLTKGSLILEIGSNGNTLSEAKTGGVALAEAIAAVITEELQ